MVFLRYKSNNNQNSKPKTKNMMKQKQAIQLFERRKVRTVWDEEHEKWYFSVVDVVGVLTDSVDGRKYWNKLKQRLKEEGNETVTNCHQLKMPASDGKMRLTDVADTEHEPQCSPKVLALGSWTIPFKT